MRVFWTKCTIKIAPPNVVDEIMGKHTMWIEWVWAKTMDDFSRLINFHWHRQQYHWIQLCVSIAFYYKYMQKPKHTKCICFYVIACLLPFWLLFWRLKSFVCDVLWLLWVFDNTTWMIRLWNFGLISSMRLLNSYDYREIHLDFVIAFGLLFVVSVFFYCCFWYVRAWFSLVKLTNDWTVTPSHTDTLVVCVYRLGPIIFGIFFFLHSSLLLRNPITST